MVLMDMKQQVIDICPMCKRLKINKLCQSYKARGLKIKACPYFDFDGEQHETE